MLKPNSRSQAKRFGVSTVTDSCGCVFCDLDLEPEIIEGEPMHMTEMGKIRCTRDRVASEGETRE